MPFYMFQGRYNSDAFKAMVDSPQDREEAGRKIIEALGGKLHHFFFSMGTDDVVAIGEAPDDEAMAALAMVLASSGAFSGGHTTKLMTSAEAQNAMKKAHSVTSHYRPATG
jgi:uncharacterized protein with GYD domain